MLQSTISKKAHNPQKAVSYTHLDVYKRQPLIKVMGSVLIINALSITQITVLTKKLDFKTKTKTSLLSAIISGIVGIGMAYTGFGVWALVAQVLSKQTIYTIGLWFFNRWWPDFSFNKENFKYMWGFGSKLMLSGLLSNIWNQLYQVVVGKFYSCLLYTSC